MTLRQLLKRVTADLDRLDIRWALVGGFAVSARAVPRFTNDLDFAIAVDSDEQAEAVVRSLLTENYRLPVALEHNEVHRLSTVRLFSPYTEQYLVDLLFAASGIENEVVADATEIQVVRGISAPVAALPHLIAMKVLSASERRPRDWDDIESLVSHASDGELRESQRLVRLILERGYGQNANLLEDIAMYIRRYRQKSDS